MGVKSQALIKDPQVETKWIRSLGIRVCEAASTTYGPSSTNLAVTPIELSSRVRVGFLLTLLFPAFSHSHEGLNARKALASARIDNGGRASLM